ncbi:MAG: MerR family transcriptional regulator [Acidimicrobiales bacterium]
MRLDALAAAAGVASTTVRLYQQRGLLPGPRLVGRTGWYDQAHLTRLRLIARLQDEGFSLAGIAKLLETWEQGGALADLVDVEAQLDALLHGRTPLELDPVELAERFPPEALDPDAMARAVALGLVELTDDGRVRVPDARFVEVGSDLARLGVPVDVVLDEWEALTAHTDEIARRFVAVFEQHLLPGDWAEALDRGRVQELAATLARLQRDAGQVVLAALDASMAAAAADRLGGLVPPDR